MCKHAKTPAPAIDIARGWDEDSQCWTDNAAGAIHVLDALRADGRDAHAEASIGCVEWRVVIYARKTKGTPGRDWDTICYCGPEALAPGWSPYWIEACCPRDDQLASISDGNKAVMAWRAKQ